MAKVVFSSKAMTLTQQEDGSVFVLNMTHSPDGKGNYENRFNPEFVSAFNAALDFIESDTTGAAALVVCSAGKFFSNGLDLAAMKDFGAAIPAGLHQLLGRLLDFGCPTVAGNYTYCS